MAVMPGIVCTIHCALYTPIILVLIKAARSAHSWWVLNPAYHLCGTCGFTAIPQ